MFILNYCPQTKLREGNVFLHLSAILFIAWWREDVWQRGLWAAADPGFPVGGGANPPGGGANIRFFPKFPKKLHEIEKILGRRGACTEGAPLDPPLHSLVKSSMCGKGVHAWWSGGMCGEEVCMAKGGMCGKGGVWWGGMHGKGACVARRCACRRDGHWSGRYVSYWNAFL